MSVSIDDIAPPSGDAWSPEIGDAISGVITYAGTLERVSQFSGHTEKVLRIDLDDDENVTTIWATVNTNINGDGWAKRDAKAIAAAVRAAGEKAVEVGGRLGIRRIADVATEKGPAKAFEAQYKAPVAKVDVPAAEPAASTEPATAAVDDLLGD